MKKFFLAAFISLAGVAILPSEALAGATSCQCYCGAWIPPPCSDQACINYCGGSSGGGGGGSGTDWSNFAWGKQGYYSVKSIPERCGNNPLCATMGLFASGIIFIAKDVPYYIVKAPIVIVKGLGKGAVYTGKAIASPFKASANKRLAKNQSLAHTPAPGCSGSASYGNPMPTFNAYQSWEECKRAVLKRQKALTKLNPSNKENEDWCKTRVPLGFGPNRLAWEERCNAGGNAVLVNDPKEVEAERAKALAGAGMAPAAGGAAPVVGQTPASSGEPQGSFTTPPAVDGAPGTAAPQAGAAGAPSGAPAQTGSTIGTGATPSNALIPFPPDNAAANPDSTPEAVAADGQKGW